MLDIIDEAVASGFRADIASSPVVALSCENTDPLVPEFLIGTKEIRDLSRTGSDITSRDIGVSANVAGELLHE